MSGSPCPQSSRGSSLWFTRRTTSSVNCSGLHIGLIQVKEEGTTGFSEGGQGCSEGFSEGEAQGKSQGAALPAQGKHPAHPDSFNWIYILFKIGNFGDISYFFSLNIDA